MKTASYNSEREMERIARESREFREAESRRIAEEREALRLALEQQKLDRVAFLSPDVSGKARKLSEKEELERRRLEEIRAFEMRRSAVRNQAGYENQRFSPIEDSPTQQAPDYVDASEYPLYDVARESFSHNNSPVGPSFDDGNARIESSSRDISEGVNMESRDSSHSTFHRHAARNGIMQHDSDSLFKNVNSSRNDSSQSQARPLHHHGGGGDGDVPMIGREGEASTDSAAYSQLTGSLISRQEYSIPKRMKKGPSAEEEEPLTQKGIQKAYFEIPVKYTGEGFEVLKEAEVSLTASMPPSRVDGRWSGRIEGRSSLLPSKASSATGAVTFDYLLNSCFNLSLGMVRGHELYHPLTNIGCSFFRQGTALGVGFYHRASFLRSDLLKLPMFSLSLRHVFSNTRWVLTSEVSKDQQLSTSLSNSKLSARIGVSLKNADKFSARVDARPKLSEDRFAHFYGEWKSGVWQIGASLIQSLHSHVATIGLGVRLYSTRGVEWICSWNRGDASIRIPIIWTDRLQMATIGHVLYFSILSYLLQEGIAEMWGWKAGESEKVPDIDTQSAYISRAKEKKDAELQRTLMSRQAKRKTKLEQEREGLVIRNAKYYVEGGDEWDVTVPLQFWVSHSTLCLPRKTKSQLLGFFNVSLVSSQVPPSNDGKPTTWLAALKDMIDDLLDKTADVSSSAPHDIAATPMLSVLYDFQGKGYRVTIEDDQELILPNPNAAKIE